MPSGGLTTRLQPPLVLSKNKKGGEKGGKQGREEGANQFHRGGEKRTIKIYLTEERWPAAPREIRPGEGDILTVRKDQLARGGKATR